MGRRAYITLSRQHGEFFAASKCVAIAGKVRDHLDQRIDEELDHRLEAEEQESHDTRVATHTWRAFFSVKMKYTDTPATSQIRAIHTFGMRSSKSVP